MTLIKKNYVATKNELVKMATSLAASMNEYFDIVPVFVEGHDGTFEVSINADRVYTNNSECSILPETSMILEKIHLVGGVPVKPLSSAFSHELSLDGAACPFPGLSLISSNMCLSNRL